METGSTVRASRGARGILREVANEELRKAEASEMTTVETAVRRMIREKASADAELDSLERSIQSIQQQLDALQSAVSVRRTRLQTAFDNGIAELRAEAVGRIRMHRAAVSAAVREEAFALDPMSSNHI